MYGDDASAGKYDVSLGVGVKSYIPVAGHTNAPGYKFAVVDELPTLEQDSLIRAHDRRQPQVRPHVLLM